MQESEVYATLDKIDIVAKAPDGLKRYIQTDHRTAQDVEATLDLSIAFALSRVLIARRLAKQDAAKDGSSKWVAVYQANEVPPEPVRRAIRAAGGHVSVGRERALIVDPGAPARLEEVIDATLVKLSRAVAVEFKVSLTLQGMAIAEKKLVAAAGDGKSDQIVYWSAVMKLGSFAGEFLRACNGGKWLASEMFLPPFALETRHRGGRSHVNLFGKAVKRFRPNGEADTVAGMVRSISNET
jgi:hypothetical protein